MSNPTPAASDPYNLLTPTALADPYPVYRRMRDEVPVHWNDRFNAWLLTRYADTKALLTDPRIISGHMDTRVLATMPDDLQTQWTMIRSFLSSWIVGSDPPDHRRLRHLLNAGFKPRLVENLRPRIQAITDELLDALQDSEQIEVIQDFAYPLPAMVIAELLGVPAQDRNLLRAWSQTISTYFLLGMQQGQRAAVEDMHQAVLDMSAYLRAIIADRRRAPQDDLISGLLAAKEQGETLGEQELISSCVLLLFAGHETTMNLLGNGLLALLRHPDQYQQLAADPILAPAAIEEFLRYESPVQFVWRSAAVDLEIGGQVIRAGQKILPYISAANRDPAQFPDPDRLDIRRHNANSHIAFGHGIHFCLGAPLARLEAQVAFPTLLRRLSGLQLASATLTWRPTLNVRGLTALPVTFERARYVA